MLLYAEEGISPNGVNMGWEMILDATRFKDPDHPVASWHPRPINA